MCHLLAQVLVTPAWILMSIEVMLSATSIPWRLMLPSQTLLNRLNLAPVVQQAMQSLSSTFQYLTLPYQKQVDLFVGANHQHDTETFFLNQRLPPMLS